MIRRAIAHTGIVLSCAAWAFAGCQAQETSMIEGRNRLADEQSPYLLQHEDNPVWWWPWGEKALAAAKAQDKPVFLSVGYSTCHWCHVMEHESFEDPEVAAFLNEHFIAIKVDREERPDVDAIYMDAVMALTQRGGWPMSVFMTGDGKPFFGGTYYPKDHFLLLLSRIVEVWEGKREALEEDAQRLAEHLAADERRERAGSLDPALFGLFVERWAGAFDPAFGGMRGAPKFPAADDLRLLLRIHRRSGDERALKMVTRTLDAMARGGIYDHLGGGFARYSVDQQWLVPHFEKMLYDQASLTLAYLEAWQVTGDQEYALVVRETLDYVMRDLSDAAGGFHSAEDADSEGVEGKFYVFTLDELSAWLSEDETRLIADAFGVTAEGNFEHGTNILHLQEGHARASRSAMLAGAMAKLFDARGRRVRPHLDDKVLTDWNGLMIGAMARAGRMLGEERYVERAARAASFALEALVTANGALLHRWRAGEAGIPGFLEDYAYLIHGLLELYQADHDPRWLRAALALQEKQEALFAADGGDYYRTDGADPTVLSRAGDPLDNVRPAGRSVSAMNLLRLGDLMLDESYTERASAIFASSPAAIGRAPHAFSHLLMALDYAIDRSKEIAVVGEPNADDTEAMVGAIDGGFRPNLVLAVGPETDDEEIVVPALLARRTAKDGAATAYVCEDRVCELPTTDPDQAAALADTYAALE